MDGSSQLHGRRQWPIRTTPNQGLMFLGQLDNHSIKVPQPTLWADSGPCPVLLGSPHEATLTAPPLKRSELTKCPASSGPAVQQCNRDQPKGRRR